MLLALVMHVLKRLEKARWLLWLLVVCFPLPLIAINMGWVAAEVGRQPWIVQGLLRTTRRRLAGRLRAARSGPRSASSA